jgi:hypothetical protein
MTWPSRRAALRRPVHSCAWVWQALTVLAVVWLPLTAKAQGALSAQGFGYPPGGLSARSQGAAGAMGEFDPLTARNPSAVGDISNAIISVQGEPERRIVRFGERTETSELQRVPLVAAGLRLRRVAILVSGTTLLDRSFSTQSIGNAVIDGRGIPTDDRLESRGAMTELRLSAGWTWKKVRLGAAAVAVTGEHSVVRTRAFPDSFGYGSVQDSGRIGFEGIGAALGMNWRPANGLLVGASWRGGGALAAVRRDSALARATVPGRIGMGVLIDRIEGTVLAASVERVGWAAMNGLGSAAAQARDVINWSVGAEIVGGALRNYPVLWRTGYGERQLPFLVGTEGVRERLVNAGLGVPLAGDAAMVDVSLQRALRRLPTPTAREDAWTLTVGLTLRP